MKTNNIKGKEYVTVNERLKEFRNSFKDYSLITEIVELGVDYATIKASIIDDKGVLRATGFAREVVAKSPINKYAFLENCETSAIGRALGNFGIGIDEAVCTADELAVKLSHNEEKPQPEDEFKKKAIAWKTARTKAIRKANEQGVDYSDTAPTRAEFEEAFRWMKKQEDSSITDCTRSEIDYINFLVTKAEGDARTALINEFNRITKLEDSIPY